jgi:RNA polymerase sigma-70 factor, ECF subfamily
MERISKLVCLNKNQAIDDEDIETLDLCQQGSLEAFEILVKKYQDKLFNIAYRMTGSHEDACEIVQDTFLSVYKNMGKFNGKSRFSTWIHAITINYSKNRLKQLRKRNSRECVSIDQPVCANKGEARIEYVSNEPTALDQLEREELRRSVQECIDSLECEHKEVIVLRDVQGFSYEEIGKMLTMAEGTVKSRLFRARASLKNCLKPFLGEL